MVCVALLTCDAKSEMWRVSLPAALQMEGEFRLYIGIGTKQPSRWTELQEAARSSGRKVDIDMRTLHSSWYDGPRFAQDQRRLVDICMARNLARDYALLHGCSHLLFIDDDVRVAPDTLSKLLEVRKPIVGGVLQGRGEHQHLRYVFGYMQVEGPHLISCDWGSAGLVLVREDVLRLADFHWKVLPDGTLIPEDQAFAMTAAGLGFGRWYIRTDVVPEHVDDPNQPVTAHTQAVNHLQAIRYEEEVHQG